MQINYQRIYEKLGYLFYAIAAADDVVSPSEVSRLRQMVERNWVPMESTTDEFGTDAAQYISISFDYLTNEGVEAGIAFEEFATYYRDHRGAFTDDLKRIVSETARAIADAFKGQNKQESRYLSKLQTLLK